MEDPISRRGLGGHGIEATAYSVRGLLQVETSPVCLEGTATGFTQGGHTGHRPRCPVLVICRARDLGSNSSSGACHGHARVPGRHGCAHSPLRPTPGTGREVLVPSTSQIPPLPLCPGKLTTMDARAPPGVSVSLRVSGRAGCGHSQQDRGRGVQPHLLSEGRKGRSSGWQPSLVTAQWVPGTRSSSHNPPVPRAGPLIQSGCEPLE